VRDAQTVCSPYSIGAHILNFLTFTLFTHRRTHTHARARPRTHARIHVCTGDE